MINVAIMGYGTIGGGVFELLDRNAAIVAKNAGQEIRVKKVLDLRDFPGKPVEKVLTHDFQEIVDDPEIDIVVEVMGGTGAAYKFVKASLLAGKSVVTSNKALVAAYGPELLDIAKEKGINFMFEASVGGGIPILRPLIRCITADDILDITGILNGTTNFILTKMYNEGSEFDATLREAQANGFAEKDPTADIEGHDTCRKIAILTALAYGQFVEFEDLPCKGITGITEADTAYAKALGMKIKLLGSARKVDGKVYAEVAPFLISPSNPLYAVDGVMNAIMVTGNMLGEVMFYGAGAGAHPTAAAVVSDIIEESKNLHTNLPINMGLPKMEIADSAELSEKYLVSAENAVDLEALLPATQVIRLPEFPEEYAVVTEPLTGADLAAKLAGVTGVKSCLKVR